VARLQERPDGCFEVAADMGKVNIIAGDQVL
jgi:hypothetical protein